MIDRRTITWIPEHNSAASFSMRRFWLALADAARPEDRYEPISVIEPTEENRQAGLYGRISRAFQRNVSYPALVRKNFQGEIAHVLDHSWADMLDHVPSQAKRVITVHDLIPLRFPGELSKIQQSRFRRRLAQLSSAHAIIAVSDYTKSEIIDLFGIHSDLIHVIPNGVSPIPHDPTIRSASRNPLARADSPFRIGSIGSVLLRKNLGVLPKILSELQKRTGRKIILERAGELLPSQLAANIREVIGEKSLVETGTLSESSLAGYYERQDVILFPSLYEGFGLPVIEAMAIGVPVVSSSSSSLPEVGGECVLYASPDDYQGFASQLAIVANGELPEDWRVNAMQWSREFTWRRSLESVFSVYDSIL